VVATEPDLAGVPPRLLEVLQPCLRKNPAQRPPLPAVAAAFSRGAGSMGDAALALTSFWPPEVADIIGGATADTPGASGTSGAARPAPSGSPLSPMPGSLPGVQPPFPSGGQPPFPSGGQPPFPSGGQPQMAPSQANQAYTGDPGAYTGQPGSYTPSHGYPSSYQPPSYHQAAPPAQAPAQTPAPGTPAPWAVPGAAPGGQTPPPQAAYGQAGYAAQQAPPWQPSAQSPAQQGPGWQTPPPGQTPAPAWTAPGSAAPSLVGPHAYKPARRRPARAEVPAPVINALWLMYTGMAATVLALILSVVDIARLGNLAKQNQYVNTVGYHHETTSIALIFVFSLIGGIIGIVIWIVCAVAVRKGREWAASLGTVFFGLDCIAMLTILLATYEDPVSKIMSVLVWVIGLVAVILIWQGPSRAFYRAFR
jgi:hypothetical protein